METPSKAKIGWAIVIVAMVAAVLFFGVNYPLPQPPEAASRGSINLFTEKTIRADNRLSSGGTLDVAGAATVGGVLTGDDVAAVDDLTVGDDVTVTGSVVGENANFTAGISAATLNLSGNAAFGAQIGLAKQTNVTVTNNSIITATNSYVGLTAVGNVGTASISGCETQGRVTLLENFANVTITITDTGTLALGGNAALGQYDTLTLLGDGVRCVQLSKADN